MNDLVSVIMPCYNAGEHLDTALRSIRNQTYSKLQIICVDDGSTDRTLETLERNRQEDHRIEIIRHPHNFGLVAALNSALDVVRGGFFARMDQDDFSVPERFATQLEFLDAHPEVEIVSTGYRYFITDGNPLEYVPPIATRPEALRVLSMYATPFAHPAVFGRSTLIHTGRYRYDPAFEYAEDFELFSRLALAGIRLANIRAPLHWLRKNPKSLSRTFEHKQVEAHTRAAQRNIQTMLCSNQHYPDGVMRVVCARFPEPVSARDLGEGLSLLNEVTDCAIENIRLSYDERREIRAYRKKYVTNVLVQSIMAHKKQRISFLMKTLSLWRMASVAALWRKIADRRRQR